MELRERLPEKAIALLDCRDEKHSEWATATAIAMHCLNAGFTEDEFYELVSGSEFSYRFASENGRDRSNRLENRLRKAWRKAEEGWNPPLESGKLREALAAVAAYAEVYEWNKRSRNTDLAVARAVVNYCHENNLSRPNLAVRSVAKWASVSPATAERALKRLVKAGMLSRDPDPNKKYGDAERYRVNLDWGNNETYSLSPHKGIYVSRLPFEHPVFLRGAVGPTAGRIWSWMPADRPITVREAVEALEIHKNTAKNNLETLVTFGLADRFDGRPVRYQFRGDVDLNQLATELGVYDTLEARALRIELDRKGFDQNVLSNPNFQPKKWAKPEVEPGDWEHRAKTLGLVVKPEPEPEPVMSWSEVLESPTSAAVPAADPFEESDS